MREFSIWHLICTGKVFFFDVGAKVMGTDNPIAFSDVKKIHIVFDQAPIDKLPV